MADLLRVQIYYLSCAEAKANDGASTLYTLLLAQKTNKKPAVQRLTTRDQSAGHHVHPDHFRLKNDELELSRLS